MINTVIYICYVQLAIAAFFALKRLLQGPTMLDRTIGFDMLTTTTVGTVVLVSVSRHTQIYIELMLIFSLLGFVGTVAFVSYLHSDLGQRFTRTKSQNQRPPEQKP
ncbi:MAG: K+/H+ antiporter subunit F [Verrucomicrobiaceae bacterium]|nr:MAG: K+/H+ antiporter subunit F [Verrucomicrobiaceae bacterium]